MGWFGESPTYDRRRILDAAARAVGKRRRRRAIGLYRWVLVIERNNPEIHAKLAPLLAETGQLFDAWQSFRLTAQAALRDGHDDQAVGIYREATRSLPREIQTWQSLARTHEKRGEQREAVEVLVEGSRRFHSARLLSQGIHLLRRARAIEPWDLETGIELARLLGRTDQRPEARLLLEELAKRVSGHALRRVRAAQFKLDTGIVTACRWLVAALRPGARARKSAGVVPLRRAAGRR